MPAPVIIVDHDSHWPEIFLFLKEKIIPVLGDLALAIEHVGSTSVPGLAAKPIIDMNIMIDSRRNLPEVIQLLATLGYVHQGDLGIQGREAFISPSGWPDHHLYVCDKDNRELHRQISFRNYLRTHPEMADKYGQLKKELSLQFRNDREGYTQAKSDFIESILLNITPD